MAYRCMQGDWETHVTDFRLPAAHATNTGALTVSIDRDKGGSGIPKKVLKKMEEKYANKKKRKK